MIRTLQIPKEVTQWTSVDHTTYTCDWCAKEVSDHGEILIGGSVNGGWYHVSRMPKSTALEELRRESQWDFCGFECLSMWVNDSHRDR
jgi:hypothetical protein